MKLGRNEKCWCESGIKYKKCHLNRDKQEPVRLGDAYKVSDAAYSRKCCSVPEELKSSCGGKIINAHTVSKSSSLFEIADATNHVLGVSSSLSRIQKNNGVIIPERIGVNKASTFKGFCSIHDKQLFACIEDKPFEKESAQLFALAYRALCKEIYAKDSNENIVKFMKELDKGKQFFEQINIQRFVYDFGQGVNAAVKELKDLKEKFDDHLLNKKKIMFRHFILTSEMPCPVAVSSILNPEVDFEGNQIQNLANLDVFAENVIFNSFSSNGKGYVVFTWLETAKVIEKFIVSLMKYDKKSLKNALIRFFFSVSENIYISPSWWDSLTDEKRDSLVKRVMIGTPFEPQNKNYLCDDGIDYDGWEITATERVCS